MQNQEEHICKLCTSHTEAYPLSPVIVKCAIHFTSYTSSISVNLTRLSRGYHIRAAESNFIQVKLISVLWSWPSSWGTQFSPFTFSKECILFCRIIHCIVSGSHVGPGSQWVANWAEERSVIRHMVTNIRLEAYESHLYDVTKRTENTDKIKLEHVS